MRGDLLEEALRIGSPFRPDQRGTESLAEDRPDLRLGPGEARARRVAALATRRPVPVQRGEQLRHALAGRGGRDQHLGPLRLRAGRRSRPRPRAPTVGDQHRPELRGGPLRAGLVALVDDDEVGDLEQAGLDRLDLVAHLGRLEHDRRVGRGRDLDLALARPDGLEQHAGRSRRRRGRPPPRVDVGASPPAWPRDAIERMNTSRSPA